MTQADSTEPAVLERAGHSISRKDISSSALKVLYRLHRAGYKGYMVGGGVRDLLLGRKPKDFDVSTDARPGEIRRLFRNSRIIGRRFRLAHIFFRDEIVEVATFRRGPDPEAQASEPGDLLITDDNVFGTPREDAFRRDFTINALFYDISDYSVIDYVDGMADLAQGVIRTIGDPDVRFREDPVRMLRACELAARLGFTIEARTQTAISANAGELSKAAPARLTEELMELLRCGAAGPAMQWMVELDLLPVFLPEAQAMLEARRAGLGDFEAVLPALDGIVRSGREVSDSALVGAVLLPAVLLARQRTEARRKRPLSRRALTALVAETIDPFFARFTLARQKAEQAVDALLAFHRLGESTWDPVKSLQFARRPAFDDALLLFEILVEATGEGREELAHWQAIRGRRGRRPAFREASGGRPRGNRRRGRGRRRGGRERK